ncbi:hypothetical protein [Pseudorhizobium flavum]|uniref:hypothetical protein n=1 Tax=Pseudorhizobium flavum TaxID=1335061 RepID=UPI003770652F
MTETPSQLVASLRAQAHSANAPPAADATAEIDALRQRCEALERENAELRRQAARGEAMLQAASSFLEAYGRKYKNLAGGGIRPTAILLNEVKVMWAVHNDFRTLTESEF